VPESACGQALSGHRDGAVDGHRVPAVGGDGEEGATTQRGDSGLGDQRGEQRRHGHVDGIATQLGDLGPGPDTERVRPGDGGPAGDLPPSGRAALADDDRPVGLDRDPVNQGVQQTRHLASVPLVFRMCRPFPRGRSATGHQETP
jgi:hypothetical protein